MKPRDGESCRPATMQLVLSAKPLPEPMPRMAVNGSISRAHRPQTKVVRPTRKHPVQSRHSTFDHRPHSTTAGQFADLGLQRRDLLRRRPRPDVEPAHPRRVAQSDCITREVDVLLGKMAEPRLRLVRRQSKVCHHCSYCHHRFGGRPRQQTRKSSAWLAMRASRRLS